MIQSRYIHHFPLTGKACNRHWYIRLYAGQTKTARLLQHTMDTCQYAKHIVDNAPMDGSPAQNRRTMAIWLNNSPSNRDRLIHELAAYLMSLENREHATRVAVLVENACSKSGLAFPLLELVEQKTRFHSGALHMPPNPDVSDEDFVLTPLPVPDEKEWELL